MIGNISDLWYEILCQAKKALMYNVNNEQSSAL